MRLTILGGGGFRVPLIHRALLEDRRAGRVTHITLYDTDATRLNVIARVLADQAIGVSDAPAVTGSSGSATHRSDLDGGSPRPSGSTRKTHGSTTRDSTISAGYAASTSPGAISCPG